MKRILGAMALMLMLLAALPLHSASASLGACGGDPVITLYPGGNTLDIQTDIADSASHVSGVKYSVFVPSTVISDTVQKSGGFPELVQVYRTNPDGQYDTYTYATDSANTVALTTTMTAKDVHGTQFGQGQATGTTNQSVHTDGGGWFPPAPL